jgi:hypothetical protein
MINVFTKISAIKNNANKIALFSYNQSSSTKIVRNIIGVNPLQKEWVDDIKICVKNAMKQIGFKRVNGLVHALERLYVYDHVLKESNFIDNDISHLIIKAETSYLNTCHSYIEQNIHNSTKALEHFSLLFEAIEVIAETNRAMAQKYKNMLSRYQSLYVTFNKILEICNFSYDKFKSSHAKQISVLMQQNRSAFKMHPNLFKDILDVIKLKLDDTLMYVIDLLKKNTSGSDLSIEKYISICCRFQYIYVPLSELCRQKRYDELIAQHNEYLKLSDILKNEYKEWVKVYDYYNLPRNNIDENKIIKTIKDINNFKEYIATQSTTVIKDKIPFENFIEIQELSPPLDIMLNLLSSLVSKQGKDSIISYYKIENDILNTKDLGKKATEIVRFLRHVNSKLNEYGIDPQLKNELYRMRDEFLALLDITVECIIKQFLSTNPSTNSLNQYLDKTLTLIYDLNDVKKVNYWQNTKKNLIKAINDLPAMIKKKKKQFDYFSNLSESTAKKIIKDKIILEIQAINDIIPTMAVFQLSNVAEYLNFITGIEKGIGVGGMIYTQGDRLIVWDKYTARNTIIFCKNKIDIGRSESKNDILLKSEWVSSIHCTIDFEKLLVIDHESTNGTFSMSPVKVKINNINLDKVSRINIADAFEILIEKYNEFYLFKIVKVYDKELIDKEKEYIQNLFNTDFVWIRKNGRLSIDVLTGKPKETDDDSNTELVVLYDELFSVIDKENSKSELSIKTKDEIFTDRFTIYLT